MAPRIAPDQHRVCKTMEKADPQLLDIIDAKTAIWLVRIGALPATPPNITLRSALASAAVIFERGRSRISIARMNLPDDPVVLPSDQVHRMCVRLGFLRQTDRIKNSPLLPRHFITLGTSADQSHKHQLARPKLNHQSIESTRRISSRRAR